MQQPIDLPEAAPAPLSVVDGQSADALGRACAAPWRVRVPRTARRAPAASVLRAAPLRDGAEEEAVRRLAAARALKTDS